MLKWLRRLLCGLGLAVLCSLGVTPANAEHGPVICQPDQEPIVALETLENYASLGNLAMELRGQSVDSTISDVLDAAFVRSCEAYLTPNISGEALWLKITLQSPSNSAISRYILFDDTYADRVTMHHRGLDGAFVAASNGRAVPHDERVFAARTPEFRLTLDAGETREVYFQVDTSAALTVHPILMTPDAYETEELRRIIFLSLIFGFMAAVTFFAVNMYYIYRLPELAYYAVYMLALLVLNVSFEGMLTRFSPVLVSPSMQDFLSEGLSVVASLSFLVMTRPLLRLKERVPSADQLVIIMIAIYVFFLVWKVFDPAGIGGIIHPYILTTSAMLVLLAFKLSFDGDRVARYFAYAKLLYLIALTADFWFLYFPFIQPPEPSTWGGGMKFLEGWVYYLGLTAQTLLLTVSFTIVIRNTRLQTAFKIAPQRAVPAMAAETPPELAPSPVDREFIERARLFIRNNVEQKDLNVSGLARELATSESSLRRRLQDAVGVTPADLIRSERLAVANERIAAGSVGTVQEAALSVGFQNAGHFSRLYQKTFGVSPKVHLKNGAGHSITREVSLR